MSLNEIIGMIEGPLGEKSKERLMESDLGNCIFEGNRTTLCLD